MKKAISFSRGAAVLATGTLFLISLASAGSPGLRYPIGFTLATTNGEPVPMSFGLAPRLMETAAVGGLGGGGYTEDDQITRFGYYALYNNTTGAANTGIGMMALENNTTGSWNTACGTAALWSNAGDNNTACGAATLYLSTGSYNTAVGYDALYNNTTGNHNTALGRTAGYMAQAGNYNIYIGAACSGSSEDTNTIRIGLHYQAAENPPMGQNRTFIAGIVETTLTSGDSPAVVGVTPQGRLGTIPEDLLPSKGDKGDPGLPGPQGPAGEGFVPGSYLFLQSGFTVPSGYSLIGTTDFMVTVAGVKKPMKITVNVYQK